MTLADTTSRTTFDAVAAEYYDATRHPTCANFRAASQILLTRWSSVFEGYPEICEVGAGKSLVAESLSTKQPRLENLMLTDESVTMLNYSKPFVIRGARLNVARAENLPVRPRSIDVLVSCLGDPYNGFRFWREVARVLSPKGRVLFTSPSYEWALAYRGQSNNTVPGFAEFELVDGTRMELPSYILSQDQQIRLLRECGIAVIERLTVRADELGDQFLSRKLLIPGNSGLPVVWGCLAALEHS
jgi:ubiquinone/menaquinone biosynthesis C-methylase UbiE